MSHKEYLVSNDSLNDNIVTPARTNLFVSCPDDIDRQTRHNYYLVDF